MHREKKNDIWKKMGDFLAGKGFYIILFLCMAAIGVSGYFLITDSMEEPSGTVAGNVAITVTPSVRPTPTPTPTPLVTPVPTPTPTPTPTTPVPSSAPAASAPISVDAGAETVFTWPVNGQILGEFSLEVVAYDETMGDWRTHQGIDISCQLGSKVMATADGVVSSVYFDDLMGQTVVVSHEGDLQSVYSNLALTPTVSVGDSVTTGQVLGAVGETAIAEGAKATHLHFEMLEDGQLVDPVSYLPEK